MSFFLTHITSLLRHQFQYPLIITMYQLICMILLCRIQTIFINFEPLSTVYAAGSLTTQLLKVFNHQVHCSPVLYGVVTSL